MMKGSFYLPGSNLWFSKTKPNLAIRHSGRADEGWCALCCGCGETVDVIRDTMGFWKFKVYGSRWVADDKGRGMALCVTCAYTVALLTKLGED